jgi:hypothetical protein
VTSTLPPLAFEPWRAAKNTLHLWCQIVGKTKLGLTPRRNHWWNVTLYVSARGLTTGRLPASTGNLEVEIDLIDHRIRARTTDGDASFGLSDCLTVATFHERFGAMLSGLGVQADIRAEPFGVPMTTPFPEDVEHRSYDADAARRFLQALQWSADVFEEFAGWFCGKTSPVQLFWHSFDLAVTRFSGRRAPALPDADSVTAEAYSHEAVSFGFWAGDDATRFPAYYSYTAPEPPGLRDQPIRPAPAASWVEQRGGSLAVLPYDDVRAAADPRSTLLEFLQSTYEAGAGLAGWDLDDTRTDWCPIVPIGDHRG